MFSGIIINLIDSTVHSAFKNRTVINISCRTVSALTSIKVKIHSSPTVGIDKLANLSKIVVILSRFTVSTQTSRVVIILARGTCDCFLFTKIGVLIVWITLRARHALASSIIKILIGWIRTSLYSSLALLCRNIINVVSGTFIQTTVSCCVVIIIVRTKFNTFLSCLIKHLILFAQSLTSDQITSSI